jgi:hypothetical protein
MYLDYLIHNEEKTKKPPTYFFEAMENIKNKGFDILQITPNDFKLGEDLKVIGHSPLTHIKKITIPKIDKLIKDEDIEGFFIAEGDLTLNEGIDLEYIKSLQLIRPTWLAYKKKMLFGNNQVSYVVGNFLIYIPIEHYQEFKKRLEKQRIIYSDTFFSNLIKDGFMDIIDKSIGNEVAHFSNVIKRYRKTLP